MNSSSNELVLRQEAVKDILKRYQEALEAFPDDIGAADGMLEVLKTQLGEKGITLYGEEVIACITLLELLIDTTEGITVETLHNSMLFMLLALAGDVKKKWAAKDREFFTT